MINIPHKEGNMQKTIVSYPVRSSASKQSTGQITVLTVYTIDGSISGSANADGLSRSGREKIACGQRTNFIKELCLREGLRGQGGTAEMWSPHCHPLVMGA